MNNNPWWVFLGVVLGVVAFVGFMVFVLAVIFLVSG